MSFDMELDLEVTDVSSTVAHSTVLTYDEENPDMVVGCGGCDGGCDSSTGGTGSCL